MPNANRTVAYYPLPRTGPSAASAQPLAELTRATTAYARKQKLVVIEPFIESRHARTRPELARALARCSENRAALLVPRITAVGADLAFLEAVLASGTRVLSADRRASGRATLALLRDVARESQSETSTRSREALRAARARGVKLGSPRPEVGSRAGVAALRARATENAAAVAPVLSELRLSNPDASLRDLAQLLDALGVPTPRRGKWGPSAVRNALVRSGLGIRRRASG